MCVKAKVELGRQKLLLYQAGLGFSETGSAESGETSIPAWGKT